VHASDASKWVQPIRLATAVGCATPFPSAGHRGGLCEGKVEKKDLYRLRDNKAKAAGITIKARTARKRPAAVACDDDRDTATVGDMKKIAQPTVAPAAPVSRSSAAAASRSPATTPKPVLKRPAAHTSPGSTATRDTEQPSEEVASHNDSMMDEQPARGLFEEAVVLLS
jgi:hypothetical protein